MSSRLRSDSGPAIGQQHRPQHGQHERHGGELGLAGLGRPEEVDEHRRQEQEAERLDERGREERAGVLVDRHQELALVVRPVGERDRLTDHGAGDHERARQERRKPPPASRSGPPSGSCSSGATGRARARGRVVPADGRGREAARGPCACAAGSTRGPRARRSCEIRSPTASTRFSAGAASRITLSTRSRVRTWSGVMGGIDRDCIDRARTCAPGGAMAVPFGAWAQAGESPWNGCGGNH